MNPIINKTSESEFTVTTTPVVTPTVITYSIDDLKNQELAILKSINDFVANQQIELDKVRALIAQANTLGLKTSEQLQTQNVVAEQTKLSATPIEPLPVDKIIPA